MTAAAETAAFAAALQNDLGIAPRENDHGGFDLPLPNNGRVLRVGPIDGEWDAGLEAHVLTHNGVLIASMTVNANLRPTAAAALAAGLAVQYA